MEKILTGKAERSMELYDYLRLTMGLTRKQIARLKFREQGILVDGVRRRVNWKLTPGETVRVRLEDSETASAHLVLDPTPVEILYEDEDILVVNKPAGVATHPGGRHYGDTMANRLMSYFYEKGESLRIRPAGRLDLETSGVLMFAKNNSAAGRLAGQRQRGEWHKEYLALVHGTFREASGTVDRPLAPDPEDPLRMVPAEETGKCAVTHYRVLASYDGFTALAVTLETGRMHQIRCHMASIGHPLLGDRRYGGEDPRISRTALHAGKLTFRQPFTGEVLEITAPIPEDMKALLQVDLTKDRCELILDKADFSADSERLRRRGVHGKP